MHIPAIGHAIARSFMPQIDDIPGFLAHLKDKGIESSLKTLDPDELKSTQQDFDANKVFKSMLDKGERTPIITSNDGHVLDGHHRWLDAANKQEKLDAHVCDCPILDLLHHAKRYTHQAVGLNEDIEHKDFGPMLDSFVSFASERLGIKSLPNIRYKDDNDDYNSFAAYHPGHKEVTVAVAGRHPMDVFRSVAHELCHHSQNEYGRLYDGAGETGSSIEDEANYMAGRIMRHFAKANPSHFKLRPIQEAIFVVGGPCSGKDRMARQLAEKYGYNEINVETLLTEEGYPWGRDFIINASADQLSQISQAQIVLEQGAGYSTTLLFVDTTNDISKLRNESRAAKGQRVLSEGVRFEKYVSAQKNKTLLAEMFDCDFHVIDNSIQEATSAKAAQNVNVKIKIDGPKQPQKKTASTKKATSTSSKKPKVKKKTPEEIKMSLEAQKQRFAEKHEKTKQKFTQDSEDKKLRHERETAAREHQTLHHQARAGEFQMKIETIRTAMTRLQPQGKNYDKIHGILKKQMAGALLGMRKYQKSAIDIHSVDNKPPAPDSAAVNEEFKAMFEHAGEWGTPELRNNYQNMTPGQEVTDFTKQDDTPVETPVDVAGAPNPTDYIGQTVATQQPALTGSMAAYSGLSEQVQSWASNGKTIERFKARYGDLWEQKILETAVFLDKQPLENKPRSLRTVQESLKKPGNDTFLNTKSKKIIKRKQ
jgi:hypothetical protein